MPLQIPFSKLPLELNGSHGKYSISREDNRELKHGYMSVIYKVREIEKQTLFALKTIWRLKDPTEEEAQNWKKAARQFDNEINTLEKLRGIPGIIQVKDRGQHEELPWYAMEYVQGKEITEGLHSLPLHDQVRVLRKLVKALSQAHQKGIVHMDLKPSNILVDNKEPVILDFGISKVVELAWESISMSTGVFGTPRYMAPEQFETTSKSTSDLHQVDIWAVGVLFYEILVESHPLGVDDSDTYNQMVHKILFNDVKDLSGFGKEVDRALAEICYRALSKEKAHRYKNASEMLHDLNQWETANFNKCIILAEEFIAYQHWQEAQKSALEAHTWSPYHPKIRECLVKALNGQYGVPLTIEWVDSIFQEMISFWLKTRRGTPPKALARIHHIHNETPYFIAVDTPRGIPLRQFLQQQEAKGNSATLSQQEILDLLSTLREVIAYAQQNNLSSQGLQVENIYYIAEAEDKKERFYLWGFGWRGKAVRNPMEGVREIERQTLSDESIAIDPQVEQGLKQSSTVEELLRFLEESSKDEDPFL